MDEFLRKLLYHFRRRKFEAELDEEMQHHLAMSGRSQFGNVGQLKEESRSMWTWTWLEQLGQDLRYALRTIRASKGFTALAVLSLALGIGANTAIYSFIDSILLRPLPVRDPQSLVIMKWRADAWPSTSSKGMSFSTEGTYKDQTGQIGSIFPYPVLQLFANNREIFANVFAYFVADRLQIRSGRETVAVRGQYVSGEYFAGMGVAPAAGSLEIEEAQQNAVLSYRQSLRFFGSAAAAIGKTIYIQNTPFTVLGVTPPEFFGAEPGSFPEIYVPIRSSASVLARAYANDPNFYWVEIMGRLRPGITLPQAQAALAPQFRRFSEDSAAPNQGAVVLPDLTLLEGATGLDSLRRRYSQPLYVLTAIVGLILLIACANIANLLLARAAARRREIAVRLSVGASRGRVVRQLLTESVLLACTGGAIGIGLAAWGTRFLTLLLASGRENFTLHAEVNWTLLAVTLGVSIVTGISFGLAPAIQATRVDVNSALKELRPWASVGRRFRLGQTLIVAQVAVSLLLLVAAGLFTRTLANLHSIHIGFNRENVLLFTINPGSAGYSGPPLYRLYADLRERLSAVPGAHAASLSIRPLPPGGGSLAAITVVGAQPVLDPNNRAGIFTVGPHFFETMQIPILAGRDFEGRDAPGTPLAAIVNQRFASQYGVPNPVGQSIVVGRETYQIVGLAGDAVFFSMKEEKRPMVYFPMQSARAPSQVTFEVRAAGDPMGLADSVRQIVRQTDPQIAISDLKTQAAHLDQEIAREVALAKLCEGFAFLALAIACVGLYGTTAYNVARRTSEIGIRMALGARRAPVLWMVLREVVVLSAAGLAIGLPAALFASRLVKSFLFGITPNDPRILGGALAILMAAALFAAWIPARRASKIDPTTALRHE